VEQKCLLLLQFVGQQMFLENSLDFCNITRNLLFRLFVDSVAVMILRRVTRLFIHRVCFETKNYAYLYVFESQQLLNKWLTFRQLICHFHERRRF